MLVGYNTNISYEDKTYHVQTEDSGKSNPVIVTLLYSSGAILASKKIDYSHLMNDPDFPEKVRKLMKAQHKSMIKDLLSGKYGGGEGPGSEEIGKGEKTGTEEAREVEEVKPTEIQDQMTPQSEEETGAEQISKSLDDILLNFIMKRTK